MNTPIEQKNNSGFFRGRASRDVFFWSYAVIFCSGLIFRDSPILIASLALFVVISIRRAHDLGKTSWWLLWAIPFLPIILLVLFFRKGQPVENKYGKQIDLSRPFFERLFNVDKMLSDQTFNSDEERVLFEAKKIQQEGATLKLDKIITKIYFEYLRSSGEAKMILKDGEAKIVRKRGSSESGAEAEKVKLCIDNDVYFFEFKKNTYVEWDGHSLSELSVYNCGKRIFAVSVADSYDDIPDEDENKWMVSKDFSYYPQKINAFIKGEWVDKFMVLDKIIDAESKKSKADFDRDSLKQNAKIAKTNFGID